MAKLPIDAVLALARNPALGHPDLDPTGGGWIEVDLRGAATHDAGAVDAMRALPYVLVAVRPADGASPDARQLVDVVAADADDATAVSDAIDAHPTAATALALLLRGSDTRSVSDGLVAESSTYSMLQAGAEHQAWLGAHVRRDRPDAPRPPVRVERDGDRLVLTLDRPEVRNAFAAATRDALLDGLAVAAADPTITEIVLAGEGPSFCSGGDLDEFGTATDPAAAHPLRLARSVGRALHELAPRVTARLHGACIGAGIELPAFAGHVVATPSATFALPEVGMGLIPGAGGTVSLPRRIGRQRTAWLAITGRPIDAATALEWGLVDELGGVPPTN